jgi:hypothetical protein
VHRVGLLYKYTRYSCQISIKHEFFFLSTFSKNEQISSSMKIRPGGAELLQTDRHDEVILVSRNFANAPQSRTPLCQITKHMTTRQYHQHLQTKSLYCTPQHFAISQHEAHNQYVVQQWSTLTMLTRACPRRKNCLLCCATSHVRRRKHKGPNQDWIYDRVFPGQGSGTSNWAEIVGCGL